MAAKGSAALALILGALPLVGLTARVGDGVIARSSVSGTRPVATATSSIGAGEDVSARVTATPPRQVTVTWSADCPLASGDVARLTGSLAGRAPLTVPIPLGAARSSRCDVSATAKLAAHGRLAIELLAG